MSKAELPNVTLSLAVRFKNVPSAGVVAPIVVPSITPPLMSTLLAVKRLVVVIVVVAKEAVPVAVKLLRVAFPPVEILVTPAIWKLAGETKLMLPPVSSNKESPMELDDVNLARRPVVPPVEVTVPETAELMPNEEVATQVRFPDVSDCNKRVPPMTEGQV